MKNLIEKWSYHLPSDTQQLEQLVKEVREEVIKELRGKMSGEVINGVLKTVLLEERLK